MLWCRRMKRKLGRLIYLNSFKEQRIFWADTIGMTRFWVCLFFTVIVTHYFKDVLGLGGQPWYAYPLGLMVFLALWWPLNRLLDWISPY